jgi:AcrR family transcriptional regulator
MNNSQAWINVGYELFAQEGHEGLQVERLARILNLNKSSFYHYFGDRTIYFEDLIQHHHKRVDLLIKDIENIRTFDPGYLHTLVNHPVTVMANMQLMRNRHIKLFDDAFIKANQKINHAIAILWSEYLGLPDQPELAMRYFQMIQDAFYTRVTFDRLHYEFLHDMVAEAKSIIEMVMLESNTSNFLYDKSGLFEEVRMPFNSAITKRARLNNLQRTIVFSSCQSRG